jgi:ribosomal protein S18 acetylase RimI-like enzyme
MRYSIRLLRKEDEPFLWEMLAQAAHEPAVHAVVDHPRIARYVKGWGRAGDLGFIAIEPSGGKPVGAAWLRLWASGDKGFGYVDDATPELAVAVLPEHRGKGIGTQLLVRLLGVAETSHPSISLNVRSDNPALRLYERLGFVKVEESEVTNRTGGTSFTMKMR